MVEVSGTRCLCLQIGKIIIKYKNEGDDALTGLDLKAHEGIMELLKKVIREESLTTLHITHREEEAEFLGDLNYVLSGGQITLAT